ncbi:MAG: insulinase family protein [Bacteroidia bacterium]|nr:insulinase family protein [Bacteroidia bacterium]MCZ2277815.1 insulinase family protein [Bacteroidia bacterium]
MFTALRSFSGDGNDQIKKILPNQIFQHQLSNGLNVISVPYSSKGVAAFYIVVRIGSREEVEEGKTGFAHFFEHMMFRGTEKYSKEKYSDELKAIGASANANTSLDRTIYHMTGNAEMLDKMMELEADRFMNLKYSVQDFKTEAGAVKGEYTKNYSNPLMKLYESYLDTAFTKHTYSHTTMGFFKDVVDMPHQYEYSLEFFNRFYRPEYCSIIVVGDIIPEKVNQLAELYFGRWQRGNYSVVIPREPEQTATRFAHLKVEKFPPQLSLLYKSPAFATGEIGPAALSMISSLLTSERSELYKKLVIKEKKVRRLDSDIYFTRDPYLFSIQATLVDEKDMEYVKNEINQAIEKLKKIPVDQARLDEVCIRKKYEYSMHLDSPDAIANSLAYFTYLTGNPESLNSYFLLLDKLTSKQIMETANKYLIPEGLTIATLSSSNSSPFSNK